jgi:hypothetical protein
VHIYYHLVLLVLSYYSMGYLSESIDHSRYSYLELFTDVAVFSRISLANEETLGYTRGSGVWVCYLQ